MALTYNDSLSTRRADTGFHLEVSTQTPLFSTPILVLFQVRILLLFCVFGDVSKSEPKWHRIRFYNLAEKCLNYLYKL